jgi:hypothetical protein
VSKYSRSHLADSSLLEGLTTHLAREHASLAEVLADLAEVDERRLYLADAFPSMSTWCVGKLHFSEQAAHKRLNAARAARRFPAIFEAVAEGRLHLSAVVLLASKLTEENAAELLAAATHKTRAEIELLIAQRFPRRDLPARIQAPQLSPGKVELSTPVDDASTPLSPPASQAPRPRLTPLAPERFGLQVTISQNTHDKLRYAQELLSHRLRPGDLAEVLDLALDALIERLEKGKFGATSGRRRGRGLKTDGRYIPLAVKHAVWQRDQGQCTFVSESGQRCPSRDKIEFDHIEEFANGGTASVSNLRLLCHAHNQYAAELKFGAEFMKHQRESARRAATKRAEMAAANRAERATEVPTERSAASNGAPPAAPAIRGTHAAVAVADQADERDVIPWLRALGIRADDARRAAKACDSIPDAPLEERVKLALGSLARSRPRPAWRPASAA